MDSSFLRWPWGGLYPTGNRENSAHIRRPQNLYPFVAFAVLATLLVGTVSWFHIYSPINIISYERDIWHHLAVLNELISDIHTLLAKGASSEEVVEQLELSKEMLPAIEHLRGRDVDGLTAPE